MTEGLAKVLRRSFLSVTSSISTVVMIFSATKIPEQWWILVTAAFLWDFKNRGE